MSQWWPASCSGHLSCDVWRMHSLHQREVRRSVFSGKNYISVKAYSGRVFLVTLRWRIFWVKKKNDKFINRICKLEWGFHRALLESATRYVTAGHQWGINEAERGPEATRGWRIPCFQCQRQGPWHCGLGWSSSCLLKEMKAEEPNACWASWSQWQETWLGMQYYFCLKETLNHNLKSLRTEVRGV